MHRVFIEYLIPLNNVFIMGDENSLEIISFIIFSDTQLNEDKEIIIKINSIMIEIECLWCNKILHTVSLFTINNESNLDFILFILIDKSLFIFHQCWTR